jgi:O-antigen/teichoic acid export membrane protein
MAPNLIGQAGETKSNVNRHFITDYLEGDLSVRVVRGGAILMGGQVLKFMITMVSTIVLARLLSPLDYGLIGMVLVITGFISLFKNLGFSAAIIQRTAITHEQVSNLFWINLLLSVGMTLLTLFIAPLVARFYGQPRLMMITAAFAVGFIISSIGAQHEALLRRQMRFVVLAGVEVVAVFTGIVAAIILAKRGAGVWALVTNQLIFVSVYSIGLWVFCSWRPALPSRNSGVRPIIAFGRDLTGFNVLNYFARNLDNLLIGKVWGAQQLGFYAKAYQLLLLPLDQLGVPLDGIAITSLSKLKDAAGRYRNAFLRMLEKVSMVSMPGIAFMAVTSDWLVRLLLGSQWNSAATIFTGLALMGLFEPVANTMGWLMISQGRSRHVFHWGIINSTMTVVSFAIGLPWGGLGVAISFSLIGAFIRMPLLFWFAGRVGPVRSADIYRTIAVPLIAAMAVVGSVLLFRNHVHTNNPVFGLGICFFLTLIAALLVYLITPQGRSGIVDLTTMLRQMVRRQA